MKTNPSNEIDPVELDAAFHEILPRVATGRASLLAARRYWPRVATEGMAGMDPAVFEEHYTYLRSLLTP